MSTITKRSAYLRSQVNEDVSLAALLQSSYMCLQNTDEASFIMLQSNQSWMQCLTTAQGSGAALSNGTAAASLLPSAARYVLPANFFNPGTAIRLKASGQMSTAVGSAGNLQLFVYLGTIASPITVFSGGTMNLAVAGGTASLTNQTWNATIDLTCRTIGTTTSSNMIGTGIFNARNLLGGLASGTSGGVGSAFMPDTSPVVGGGFDSTTTNTVDLAAAFSVANANNSIQLFWYTLESLN